MSVQELQKIISPKFTETVFQEFITKQSGLSEVKVNKIELGAASKKGDSYLSHVFRFKVEVTGKNKQGSTETISIPVIAKYLHTNLARRKTYRAVEFFENEVIFYEKVWVPFQKFQDSKKSAKKFDNIPTLLSACIDGVNDYVAMIDLGYDGYVSTERGAGLDREHSVAILRVLGGFHAVSLAFKDQQPKAFEEAASSLKETYFSERLRPWYSRFQEKLFIIVRDAVQKELPPLYLERLNKLISGDFYGVLCKACEERGPLAVVAHGDVWAPNFLVQYQGSQPGKVTMIDFQLTRYASLATDLTFFLYSCVDLNLLEQQFDDLLEEYHKALVENLVNLGSRGDLVPLQVLHDEIKTYNAFGVGMSIEAIIMALLDDDDISDLDAIQGTEAVPLESVWIVHPFKEQEKRRRLAGMIKFAVDRNFI